MGIPRLKMNTRVENYIMQWGCAPARPWLCGRARSTCVAKSSGALLRGTAEGGCPHVASDSPCTSGALAPTFFGLHCHATQHSYNSPRSDLYEKFPPFDHDGSCALRSAGP